MTDAKETPQPEVSNIKKERLVYLVIGVALAGTALYFFVRSHFPSTNAEARNVELEQRLANISEKLAELKTADMYRQDQQQAKKSRLQQAADRGKLTAATIDTLSQQIEAWQKGTAGLATSEKGRALAASPTLLQQFSALQKQKRPTPDIASQLRTRLDIILTPIDKALHAENTPYAPSDDLTAQLTAIETDANKAVEIYRDQNQQLQAVLAQVPDTAPPGAPALQDALDAQEKAWANERAQRLAAELDKARRENAEKAALEEAENQRKIAAADREKERRLAEAKAKDISSTADKEVASINAEIQKKKDEAEAERQRKERAEQEAKLEREFEADLPDIRAHLKSLFADSYSQPIPGHMRKTTNTKGPMSLTAIRSTNALQEGKEGLFSLWNTVVIDKERSKAGGWPNLGDNQEFYIEAQKYLIKYGDLMVKKGLLAP